MNNQNNNILLEAVAQLLKEYPSMTVLEAAQVIDQTAYLLRHDGEEEVTFSAEDLYEAARHDIQTAYLYLLWEGHLTMHDNISLNPCAMELVLDDILARI